MTKAPTKAAAAKPPLTLFSIEIGHPNEGNSFTWNATVTCSQGSGVTQRGVSAPETAAKTGLDAMLIGVKDTMKALLK